MNERPQTFLQSLWARYDETKLIKAVFGGMLIGVVVTLAIDYRDLMREQAVPLPNAIRSNPVLPPVIPQEGTPGEQSARPEMVTTPAETHRNAMTMELAAGGVLKLTGSITPQTAALFLEKVEPIREYVKTVSLDSPGGFLEDALVIGDAIRENGFETAVAEGALCASACPLIFAGGTKRSVDAKAAFGLHQIYSGDETPISSALAMAGAQSITARITRYLQKMDVDPAVWTHALETPPANLYYLSEEELKKYGFTKP